MGITIKSKIHPPMAKGTPYGQHMLSKQVTGSLQITKKTANGEKLIKEATEKVHPGVMGLVGSLHEVTVEGSHTINLGNYESARIGLAIRVPCTGDTLQAAYEFGMAWINERMEKEIAKIKGDA